jgi:DNA-binding SARP family transcriptional activator
MQPTTHSTQARPAVTDARTSQRPLLRVGAAVVVQREGEAAWPVTGKAAVVLAWVALEGHAEKRRLAEALWPEAPERQRRTNLRVLVHRVNQRFGAELLVGAERLALAAPLVELDLHDREVQLEGLETRGIERCELLADAGIDAEAGEALRAWLGESRQRYRRARLLGLQEALTQARLSGLRGAAARLARACVQVEPLSEQWHRQLMEVLAGNGDRAAALTAYEDCKAMLRQHLGVLPDLQTRSLQLKILQEQARGPQGAESAAVPADGLALLGGAARYPLVERDDAVSQAQAALAKDLHVVVQGEPGVGKTRLLRHLAEGFGGGVEPVVIRSGSKREPYAAMAQLLQELQARRAPCIDVPEQIELARLAPLAFAEVRPSEAALSAPRLHAALRHWLQRLRQAGVKVLLLDDVQNADEASQAALAGLLEAAPEGAERVPVLLLGLRSGETAAVLDEAVTESQLRHRARRVELPRLTLAGVRHLLRAMDGAVQEAQAEALAQRLLRRTGGNPLFVIELARQVLEQGEAADTASLQALLRVRLEGCSVAAQQLAAVAAVADEDFTVELAEAATGQAALGLMPAWAELQQRGLFAGHGLAHDLVQDAVLAGLPQAILRQLHRQVAQHLEGHGQQGAPVLRHWMAAEDADRAMPHAVHHLYAVSAAGLPTTQLELDLLGLLERASDAVLLEHLWLTAEINGTTKADGSDMPESWLRLRVLRGRVERLPPQGSSSAWIAFETGRGCYNIDGDFKVALRHHVAAAALLPEHGVERAWVEMELADTAFLVTGDVLPHLIRCQRALDGLSDDLPFRRVRAEAEQYAGSYLNPAESLRAMAARQRAARRRGDRALVADCSARMSNLQLLQANCQREFRHHCRSARVHGHGAQGAEAFQAPFLAGIAGLCAGHYDLSQRLLARSDSEAFACHVPLVQALLYLRLGEVRQARLHMDQVDPLRQHSRTAFYRIFVYVEAQLEFLEGRDPLLSLRRRLGPQTLQALGIGGIPAAQLTWELTRQTLPAAQQIEPGLELLALFRQLDTRNTRFVKAWLEVAEAHASARMPGSQALAYESARLLRRGYSSYTLYMPESLLRCARLLVRDDPREAASLVHVARRWVHTALAHVPAGMEQGFAQGVAANRLLLGSDEEALYTAPLA